MFRSAKNDEIASQCYFITGNKVIQYSHKWILGCNLLSQKVKTKETGGRKNKLSKHQR